MVSRGKNQPAEEVPCIWVKIASMPLKAWHHLRIISILSIHRALMYLKTLGARTNPKEKGDKV